MKLDTQKRGFTLAEILITLTIIGVIAALTIPTLMNKYTEHATISKVKKTYSILANAWNLAIQEYGQPLTWTSSKGCSGGELGETADCLGKILSNYLKINFVYPVIGCVRDPQRQDRCIGHTRHPLPTQIDGTDTIWLTFNHNYGEGGWMQLADGTDVALARSWTYSTAGNPKYPGVVRILVFADTNGFKNGPNVFGKDIFTFASFNDCKASGNGALLPVADYMIDNKKEGTYCNPANTDVDHYGRKGMSYSDWIIRKGNMDYLKKKPQTTEQD